MSTSSGRPALSAVLLAAGMGTRMGPSGARSKLALPLGGGTVVGTSLRALLDASVFSEVVVVVGHAAASVEAASRAVLRTGDRVSFVTHAGYAAGMSGSIAAGVQALASAGVGVAVALADLSLVRSATVRLLARRLADAPLDAVVRPVYDGRPGHPVLFGAALGPALAGLRAGDDGARALVGDRPVLVTVSDPGVVLDIDTPEALQAARALFHADGTLRSRRARTSPDGPA